MPPRRILGIDPGTRHVGYGVIAVEGNALRRIAGGTIHAKGDDIAPRLVAIHQGLQEVIRAHRPASVAVETVFAGDNIKTAIAIGEGRGVAVLSAAEEELPVFGYEPATVKRAVSGSGRASKGQVQEMVRVLLGLPEAPTSDHEADALALAITHARREDLARTAGIAPRPKRSRPGRRRR